MLEGTLGNLGDGSDAPPYLGFDARRRLEPQRKVCYVHDHHGDDIDDDLDDHHHDDDCHDPRLWS